MADCAARVGQFIFSVAQGHGTGLCRGLKDIMYQSSRAAQSTQQPFTFYMAAAIIYLGLTMLITGFMMWLEWRANPASRYAKKISRQSTQRQSTIG